VQAVPKPEHCRTSEDMSCHARLSLAPTALSHTEKVLVKTWTSMQLPLSLVTCLSWRTRGHFCTVANHGAALQMLMGSSCGAEEFILHRWTVWGL